MEGQAEAGLGRYNPQVGAVVIEVWKASGYDNFLFLGRIISAIKLCLKLYR